MSHARTFRPCASNIPKHLKIDSIIEINEMIDEKNLSTFNGKPRICCKATVTDFRTSFRRRKTFFSGLIEQTQSITYEQFLFTLVQM